MSSRCVALIRGASSSFSEGDTCILAGELCVSKSLSCTHGEITSNAFEHAITLDNALLLEVIERTDV